MNTEEDDWAVLDLIGLSSAELDDAGIDHLAVMRNLRMIEGWYARDQPRFLGAKASLGGRRPDGTVSGHLGKARLLSYLMAVCRYTDPRWASELVNWVEQIPTDQPIRHIMKRYLNWYLTKHNPLPLFFNHSSRFEVVSFVSWLSVVSVDLVGEWDLRVTNYLRRAKGPNVAGGAIANYIKAQLAQA